MCNGALRRPGFREPTKGPNNNGFPSLAREHTCLTPYLLRSQSVRYCRHSRLRIGSHETSGGRLTGRQCLT